MVKQEITDKLYEFSQDGNSCTILEPRPPTGTIICGMKIDIAPRFPRSDMDGAIISVKRQICA